MTFAIDPLVPTAPLIDSLRALQDTFSDLPSSFFTEGIGGAERRLRDGSASLAFCLLLPSVPDDLMAYRLMDFTSTPVVAADHPLARLDGRLVALDIFDQGVSPTGTLPIYAAYLRSRPPGKGAKWLLQDVWRRFRDKRRARMPPHQ